MAITPEQAQAELRRRAAVREIERRAVARATIVSVTPSASTPATTPYTPSPEAQAKARTIGMRQANRMLGIEEPYEPEVEAEKAQAVIGGAREAATQTALTASAVSEAFRGGTNTLDKLANLLSPNERQRVAATQYPTQAFIGAVLEGVVDPKDWLLARGAASVAAKVAGPATKAISPVARLLFGAKTPPMPTGSTALVRYKAPPSETIPLGTTGKPYPIVVREAPSQTMKFVDEAVSLRAEANRIRKVAGEARQEYSEMFGRAIPQTPIERMSAEGEKALKGIGKQLSKAEQRAISLERKAYEIEQAEFRRQIDEAGGVTAWLDKITNESDTPGTIVSREIPEPYRIEIVKRLRSESKRTGVKAEALAEKVEQARLNGVPDKDLANTIGGNVDSILPETFQETKGSPFSWLSGTARSIKRLGAQGPIGRTLQRLWGQSLGRQDQMRARWHTVADEVFKGLSKSEKQNLIDFVEGYGPAMSPKIEERAAIYRQLDDSIWRTGAKIDEKLSNEGLSGMGVYEHYRENHFPHHVDMTKLTSKSTQNKLAATAVERGIVSPDEVDDFVKQLDVVATELSNDPYLNPYARFRAIKRAGNIEFSRKINDQQVIELLTDLGIMDRSENGFRRYIDNIARRYSHAEQFGGKNERFTQAWKEMTKPNSGVDTQFVSTWWENLANPVNRQRNKVWEAFDNLVIQPATNIGKTLVLPLSPLSQAAAVTNIGMVPTRTAVRGAKAFYTNRAAVMKELAENTAILRDYAATIAEDAAAERGNFSKFADWSAKPLRAELKAIGAHAVDKHTRGLFYSIGKIHIQNMFDEVKNALSTNNWTRAAKNAQNELNTYFPDFKEILARRGSGTVLLDDEVRRGASQFANLMAGNPNKANLPYWTTHGFGRYWSQLKRTALQNTGLQIDRALNPALIYARTGGAEGSLAPLLKLGAIGLPVGYTIGTLKDIAQGREPVDPFTFAGLASAITNSFVGGIVLDTALRMAVSAYGRYGGELDEGELRVREPEEMAVKAVELNTPLVISSTTGMISGKKTSGGRLFANLTGE